VNNESLDENFNSYGERFDRDHDRLRAELMASLPEAPAGARAAKGRAVGPTFGQRVRAPRLLFKVAAMVAAVAVIAGLLFWLRSGPTATAGVVFADVLQQIRKARTVTYNSTLELGQHAPRTSMVMFKEPGHERKVAPGGQLQISDFGKGRILYVEPEVRWTFLIEYTPRQEERLELGPLERLKKVREESGVFVGEQELAGQAVHVFKVEDESDQMTIWAESQTGLPVRVQIVTSPKKDGKGATTLGATLTLSDFVWNEELDDALFELKAPEGYEHYQIQLMDNSRPVTEEDLLEAFRILTDLSDGAFPDSLFAKSLMPILERLGRPPATGVGRDMGHHLLAGPPTRLPAGEPPPMVQYFRADQKKMQVARGTKFVDQLTFAGTPWGYVGKGFRQGQKNAVFWYQPEPGGTYRVIYANLRVRDASPKKWRERPPESDGGAAERREAE
jgi:hypothetical protein